MIFLASSKHYFHLNFVLFCEILKNGDVRKTGHCQSNDHYMYSDSVEWINITSSEFIYVLKSWAVI